MPAAPAVLAAVEVADQAVLAFWALLSLGFVLMVADKATSVWFRFKKQPADHERYATKAEMRAFEERVETQLSEFKGSLDTRLDNIDRTIGSELRSINRALGRLEGPTKA